MNYIIFWNVKGYKGIEMNATEITKFNFNEIGIADSKIVEKIEKTFKNNGVVFALHKKKVIKAIYIFKLVTKGKLKTLILDEKIILEEVDKCVEEFEKDLETTILNSLFYSRSDINKIIWHDKEITETKLVNNNTIKIAKVFIWLGMAITCIFALMMVVLGANYSVKVPNASIEEIQKDELLIDHVSELNNYSYVEVIDVFADYEDSVELLVFEIIIPTIFILLGYAALIFALKKLLDLLHDVTDEESLFTRTKSNDIGMIAVLVMISSLFLSKELFTFAIVTVFLEIIVFMFTYCVKLTTKK